MGDREPLLLLLRSKVKLVIAIHALFVKGRFVYWVMWAGGWVAGLVFGVLTGLGDVRRAGCNIESA